jgi:hypothetical protein
MYNQKELYDSAKRVNIIANVKQEYKSMSFILYYKEIVYTSTINIIESYVNHFLCFLASISKEQY